LGGAGADAAVDLDQERAPPVGARGVRGAYLVEHLGHERLAAESRLDGHDEQQIDRLQPRRGRGERCAGLERQPGPRAGRAHRGEGGARARAGLEVHRDLVGAGVAERPQHRLGVLDHQVHVQECRRHAPRRGHDERSERQVRDEVVVHDVAVHPVPGGIDDFERLGQAGQIRGQDRGRRDGAEDRQRGSVHRISLPVACTRICVWRVMRRPGAGSWNTIVPIEGAAGGV